MPRYDGASIPYRNAVCANEACTTINVEIQHPLFGWTPTAVDNTDPETTVLFQRIRDAEDAEPWEEPTPAPDPVPAAISRRQFYTALLATGLLNTDEYFAALRGDTPLPAPLQTIIDGLPLDQQVIATGLLIAATDFQRDHPLVDVFRNAMGWTVPQVDQFFRDAAQL